MANYFVVGPFIFNLAYEIIKGNFVTPKFVGILGGYRKVWAVTKDKGVRCRRDTVMEIVKELNPDAVESRRKRRLCRRGYSVPGPNFLWHIDGYDKLKPYGFSIHGCIDGYSRRLLWLEIGTTNKKTEVIAYHYLSTVKEVGGVPTRIRADNGTEHSIIEPLQIALRSKHEDEFASIASFLIGTSPANQRIESYWSQLAKDRPIWWREMFAELSNQGFLDASNPIVLECVRYAFMGILRQELQEVALRWNKHVISKSRTSMPSGKPNTMYFCPSLSGGVECLKDVDFDELSNFDDPAFISEASDNCPEMKEFAERVLQARDVVNIPRNVQEAFQIYFILLDAVDENL